MRSVKPTTKNPIDTLRALPMFGTCSDRELRRIDRVSTRVRVAPGRVLIREGEPGSEFFVLVAGEVAVTRGGRTLNRLGAGAAFGEISLLDLGLRTATVVATEPSELLVFNRAEFASLLGIAPRAGNELMRRAFVHVRRLDPDETEPPADPRSPVATRAG